MPQGAGERRRGAGFRIFMTYLFVQSGARQAGATVNPPPLPSLLLPLHVSLLYTHSLLPPGDGHGCRGVTGKGGVNRGSVQ